MATDGPTNINDSEDARKLRDAGYDPNLYRWTPEGVTLIRKPSMAEPVASEPFGTDVIPSDDSAEGYIERQKYEENEYGYSQIDITNNPDKIMKILKDELEKPVTEQDSLKTTVIFMLLTHSSIDISKSSNPKEFSDEIERIRPLIG